MPAMRDGHWRRGVMIAATIVCVLAVAVTVAVLRPSHSKTAKSGLVGVGAPASPSGSPADLIGLTSAVPCQPPDPTQLASREQFRTLGAVAAVRCVLREQTYSDGEWTVQVRQVSQTGISALVRAIDIDDQPATTGACDDMLITNPAIALVNTSGNYLFPRFPHDGCGQPMAHLADLVTEWQDVSTTKIKQQRTRAELDAGCAHQWKNEIYIDDQQNVPLKPSAGGPILTYAPAGSTLHVCLYSAGSSEPDVGTFDRGLSVTASDADQLRTALSGAGTTQQCDSQSAFAVITPTGSNAWVNVELGGCWRVQRLDGSTIRMGTADSTVVKNVLGLS